MSQKIAFYAYKQRALQRSAYVLQEMVINMK